MKKGKITMAVPEWSWLWPYIEYDVEFNDEDIIVDGSTYPNDNYHLRGFVEEVNEYDIFFDQFRTI